MNRCENTTDRERFAKLNDEWRSLIIEGSGNEYVRQLVERLRTPVHRLLFSTFYVARRINAANLGHRRVTEAILEGRPRIAERRMRAHIAAGLEALAHLDEMLQ